MKRHFPPSFLLPPLSCLLLSACSSGPVLTPSEKSALAPFGDRGSRFEDAAGLEGKDRDAFFWLMKQAASAATVNASEQVAWDRDRVTPESLSGRIKQAREAQKWPWAPHDEDVWRRGVLMYRVATEDLSDWSGQFMSDGALVEKVDDIAKAYDRDREGTMKKLVYYLNTEWLATHVEHKARKLPDLTPVQLRKEGGGRATDLAIGLVCLLRTFGVPAVMLRAAWLARDPGTDAWVGILGTDIWVKPADTSHMTDAYFSYRRNSRDISKVFVQDGRDGYPDLAKAPATTFFIRYNFCLQQAFDITDQAGPTASVEIPETADPGFLAVFNNGAWLEAAPGVRGGGKFRFGPCGACDVLYLPVATGHFQIPAGNPFILHQDGAREELVYNPDPPDPPTWRVPDGHDGETLRVWTHNNWETCIPATTGERQLSACPGALYIFWKDGPENGGQGRPVGRPFTIDKDGSVRSL